MKRKLLKRGIIGLLLLTIVFSFFTQERLLANEVYKPLPNDPITPTAAPLQYSPIHTDIMGILKNVNGLLPHYYAKFTFELMPTTLQQIGGETDYYGRLNLSSATALRLGGASSLWVTPPGSSSYMEYYNYIFFTFYDENLQVLKESVDTLSGLETTTKNYQISEIAAGIDVKKVRYISICYGLTITGKEDRYVCVIPVTDGAEINAEDRTIMQGDQWNPYQNVTFTDIDGTNITANLTVFKDEVDTYLPGDYQVTYQGTSAKWGQVTKTIKVTVKAQPPVIHAKNQSVPLNSVWNDSQALEGVTATGFNGEDLSAAVTVKEHNVNTSVPGVYTVTYEVPYYDAVGEKTVQVTVNPALLEIKRIDSKIYDTAAECSFDFLINVSTGQNGIHLWASINGKVPVQLAGQADVSNLEATASFSTSQLMSGKNLVEFWVIDNENSTISNTVTKEIEVVHLEGTPLIQKVPINTSLSLENVDSILKSHTVIHSPLLTYQPNGQPDTTQTGFQWAKINLADSQTPTVDNINMNVPVNIYGENTTFTEEKLVAVDVSPELTLALVEVEKCQNETELFQLIQSKLMPKSWAMDDGEELNSVITSTTVQATLGSYEATLTTTAKNSSQIHQTIRISVTGRLAITYLPETIQFEKTKIQSKKTYVFKENSLDVQLDTSLGADWILSVHASDFKTSEGYLAKDLLVNRKKDGTEEQINATTSSVIATGIGNDGSSQFVVPMSASEGIILKVPTGSVRSMSYTAKITWTLASVPIN